VSMLLPDIFCDCLAWDYEELWQFVAQAHVNEAVVESFVPNGFMLFRHGPRVEGLLSEEAFAVWLLCCCLYLDTIERLALRIRNKNIYALRVT